MKRPRRTGADRRRELAQLRSELGMLQGIVSALVARLGGEVLITDREIDRLAGEYRMGMQAGPEAVRLRLERVAIRPATEAVGKIILADT